MISLPVVLAVAALLVGIGLYGVLGQTNAIMVIMGVELMLGAAMATYGCAHLASCAHGTQGHSRHPLSVLAERCCGDHRDLAPAH